jgi:hypothetical protein
VFGLIVDFIARALVPHTEIRVLPPCAVRWSVHRCTWTQDLGMVPAGTIYRVFDAPAGKRRTFAAVGDAQTAQIYVHREAVLVFAAMAAPWFRGDRADDD